MFRLICTAHWVYAMHTYVEWEVFRLIFMGKRVCFVHTHVHEMERLTTTTTTDISSMHDMM